MTNAETLAERVESLRHTGIELTDYDDFLAVQAVEPRAEIADTADFGDGAFSVICRPMTIREAADARRLVTYDTELPEGFIEEFSGIAGDPRRKIVWCYDAGVFGGPAAITPEGDALLAAYLAAIQTCPPRESAPGPSE